MNNGKTIGFEVGPNSPPVKLTADIFEGKTYVLKQFHLHFGCEGEKGSEHSIDGEKFSGEVRKMKIRTELPLNLKNLVASLNLCPPDNPIN